ncbi:hypothetical protein QBC37DRAFT_372065 [Rhypophila decipiens]|uniref:Uncharacterized protein n=1 Tax=Rhypophila decipiens TaxID=261697 RepID=A0AAN6YA10_9PEZI|nr:hypothetical protein QBC37DRAFT_372065 [Rhypophila decipiens]
MATPCYRANGTRDETLFACNPSDDTSPCCRANDLCLSNGLCLNLGGHGDNSYSTQGCTDPKWGSPCLSRCGDKMLEFGLGMWPYPLTCCSCNSVSASSLPEWCCWRGEKCCGWPETRFQLPLFKAAGKPGSAATEAPDIEAGGGSSTYPSPTSINSDITGSRLDGNGTADPNGSGHPMVLGIGLGLGLGLGLLLFACAVTFFTIYLRRKKRQDYRSSSDSAQHLARMSLTRPGSRTTSHWALSTNNLLPHWELDSTPHILQPPSLTGASSGPAAVRERANDRVQSAIMLPTEPAAAEMPVPSNNRVPFMFL